MRRITVHLALFALLCVPVAAQPAAPSEADLDQANPVRPLPGKLAGHDTAVADLDPSKRPDPEKARLGRWLFFDKRLSADGSISCATCHRPENAFSEPTPVSTGIKGQKGGRKAPSFVNAVYAFTPETFWDGRAKNLEDQAVGPIANPIEMGETHEAVAKKIAGVAGYKPFFKKAFGDDAVTIDRIGKAIADYERTRVSGNSAYDKWKALEGKGAGAVTNADQLKLGEELFFGKALCSQCHVGQSFTDSRFHNLGIGYDPATKKFKDEGRSAITKEAKDTGAFKTPGLRDTARHAPYMHDGSLATLADVVEHYRKGGTPNPYLSEKMKKIDLTDPEAKALVVFMESLNGEGFADEAPKVFPQ